MMLCKIQIIILTAFVISGWAETRTNVELLREILSPPIRQAVDSVGQSASILKIQSRKNSDLTQWLIQQLRQDFLQKKFQVVTEEDTEKADLTIVIEEVKSSIVYKSVDHDWLFRVSKYERAIETVLSFYLKNKQESILYSGSKNRTFNEVISASQLKQVENKFYPFSTGIKVTSNKMSKIIEPAIVSITTAAMVYLFFSLRSGSK